MKIKRKIALVLEINPESNKYHLWYPPAVDGRWVHVFEVGIHVPVWKENELHGYQNKSQHTGFI